jgi:hypothetical protein
MIDHFSVEYRNPGHWDIYGRDGRLFRIRGMPGAVIVYGAECSSKDIEKPFRSVSKAMVWICALLMGEEAQGGKDGQ